MHPLNTVTVEMIQFRIVLMLDVGY